MFAVRSLFSVPGRLQEDHAGAGRGRAGAGLARRARAAARFSVHEGDTGGVIDAAYRYARHEAGVDMVLFGTGNADHLRSNVASILKPPCRPRTQRG